MLATAVIAVFTALLFFVTWGLLKEARKQFPYFRENVEATKTAALASQADVALARQEFLASHPPELIVRRVRFDDSKPGKIHYNINNIGDSTAVIEGSNATIRVDVRGHRPVFPPYGEEGNNAVGQHTINVGDEVLLYTHSKSLENMRELIEEGSHEVMFLGWITYRNVAGNKGYTAFARIYDPSKRGFVNLDGSTPEYDGYDYRT
jgi:hypothetical protein